MKSIPDFIDIINRQLPAFPPVYSTADTSNFRIFSIVRKMIFGAVNSIKDAQVSLADKLSIDIFKMNDCIDSDWHNTIETVKRWHTDHIDIPIQIPIWHFHRVLNDLRLEFSKIEWADNCWSWFHHLKKAVNAQRQFREILLPCMEAQLLRARQDFERSQKSLAEVREIARTYNWAVKALAGIVSAFPEDTTVHNYRLFKNLRTDLHRLRSLARQAYFFDTAANRKQNPACSPNVSNVLDQQKKRFERFQNAIVPAAPRQMRNLSSCWKFVEVVAVVSFLFALCVSDPMATVPLQNYHATYGNARRFLTQCPQRDHSLSPVEKSFYRYDSGDVTGKQDLVDLFLAAEAMTPINSQIAFQLALDDYSKSPNDVLNKVSRAFVEDFECAGNSVLVNFIRHDYGISDLKVAIGQGAALEATLHSVTPIMAAIFQEKPEIIRFLWEYGANTSTALGVLKGSRDSDMRRLACEIEGCQNTFTGKTTELHRLVTTASADEVAALIASGADVNAWDEYGDSPLDLALRVNAATPEIAGKIAVLLHAGATIRYSWFSASIIDKYTAPLRMTFNEIFQQGSGLTLTEVMVDHRLSNPLIINDSLLSKKEHETALRKVIAHAFETKWQHSILIHHRIVAQETGGHSPLFAAEMRQSFDSFVEQYGWQLGASEVALVRSILAEGTNHIETLSAEQIVAKIQAREIVQVHAGFTGHAIELLFIPTTTDTFLVINNKGGASRKPIEIYCIDPRKITLDAMHEVLQLESSSAWNYEWWYYKIGLTLGTQATALTTQIEEAYPAAPLQVVGSCAWESVETSVYSALALGRLTQLPPSANIAKELTLVSDIFTQWLAFTQLFVVEKYFDLHTDPAMQLTIPMDQEAMDDVLALLEIALAVLPDGKKRFANLEARYTALLNAEERLGYHMHAVWMRTFAANLRERETNPLRVLAAAVRAI